MSSKLLENEMTTQEAEKLAFLKKEVNSPKSALIQLMRKVGEVSPTQAAQLDAIIGRLEAWQNK